LVYQQLSILSTPYSLGGGKGMVPIMKLLLHVSNLAFLAGRRLTYGIIGALEVELDWTLPPSCPRERCGFSCV